MTIRTQHEIEVAARVRNLIGECPMWHPTEQCLYWVDTRKSSLFRLEADGKVREWPMPTNLGSFAFRRGGGMIGALKTGFCEIDLSSGEVRSLIDPEPDRPENRLNDGRCDRRGRFWCGSRDPSDTNPGGGLYRLDPDLRCTRMEEGIIVSNGLAFAPDDRSLVYADTRQEVAWKYDFDLDEGAISNRRVFMRSEGLPWRIDGATFDSEGGYWCALVSGGAVGRFDPHGRLDRLVQMPVSHPTMCNFGGPGLDVLYVTSGSLLMSDAERAAQPLAGSLFAIRGLGVRGVAEPFFGG